MVVNRMRVIGSSSGSLSPVLGAMEAPCAHLVDGHWTSGDAVRARRWTVAERAGQEVFRVRYGLLGPVEVRASDADFPAELGSPLQRVLLGLLLTERDRSVSLDRIVDELWGDAPPADPEGSVHTYVSRLRRVLEPGRGPGSPPQVLL